MRHVRRGFTLIELLIVVAIIAILSAIAIPKFAATKGNAYFAGMRSDLRNLVNSEESFFFDHSAYTIVLDSLHYQMTTGNTVTITEATLSGWSATVSSVDAYPHYCALFTGTAAAVAPATTAGVVACK
ncbi:MAG: prepilin-type N-terminal cleavage/methylation domain-containing protein [Gemmatimonadaceae bacterium]